MRFVTADLRDGRQAVPALLRQDGQAIPLGDLLERELPDGMLALIREPALQDRLQAGEAALAVRADRLARDVVCLRAPLRPVRDVLCVGKNYREHIDEGLRVRDPVAPTEDVPILFTKATTSVQDPGGPVVAWGCTAALDYEAELAVVIGRGGRNIPRERAYEHVFGYTLLNDVTARDLQDRHRQWFRGKSLDTFCPLGPVLLTRDELDWPVRMEITLAVNGEMRQHLHTEDMVFDIPTVIAELSRGMTLLPGDIIATGTGAGCAWGFSPPRFLRPGDVVTITGAPIGVLENTIVGENDATSG